MYTIIGLGNKGEKYARTRHNVAWMILNSFTSDWQKNKYAEAELASARIGEADVLLVKPCTFMNESGRVLPYLSKEYGTSSDSLIVIHDDIDLPLGEIRISYDRGDGGHNGVKSIMSVLESKQFARIRVGVSILDSEGILRKPDVLGLFSKEEEQQVYDEAQKIAHACEVIVLRGRDKAMNQFNQK